MFRRKPSYKNNIVVAVDIGTTKVTCAIAKLSQSGQMDIIGVGQHVTRGVKRGIIIDMDAVTGAIAEAMATAERQADESVHYVYVGLPAQALISCLQVLELSLTESPIGHEDLETIFRRVCEMMGAHGKEVLHVFPLLFELDGQKGIVDPKGMMGHLLKVTVHIVMIPNNVLRNYMACLNKAHLEVLGLVASPYASALATLVPDERELGVILIDMGGGATSLIGYVAEKPVLMASIPIGGAHITQDIARVFSTPLAYAERLKALHGSALISSSDERESIPIPQVGQAEQSDHLTVAKAQINHVIRSRLEEIFVYLKQKWMTHPEERFLARVVLTGGGSRLNGIREFAMQILGKPVRVVDHAPNHMALGADVGFSTCAGILTYAAQEASSQLRAQQGASREGLVNRMKDFLHIRKS